MIVSKGLKAINLNLCFKIYCPDWLEEKDTYLIKFHDENDNWTYLKFQTEELREDAYVKILHAYQNNVKVLQL